MLEVAINSSSISLGENESNSNFYEDLKASIDDPNCTYKNKVFALSTAWESFSACCNQYSNVIPHIYNDTLMIVLQFEWEKLRKTNKNHLKITLQNAASRLVSCNFHAYHICQRSLRVVNNPWNYPIVTKISNGTSISKSEGCDFFLTEMPVLLNTRLDRICWDDKCKDLALKLVAFYRKCFQESKKLLEPVCSVACQQLWLDLHVALLYICNEKDEVANMLEIHLSEGSDLVKRLVTRTSQSWSKTKRGSGINRIWREHGKEIFEFANQCLLSTAFIKCPPPECLASLTIQFVNLQKMYGRSSPDIIKNLHILLEKDQLKKLMTSAHMYIFCGTLFEKFGDDFRSFCIEFYVKAVIVDLNYLEKQKWDPKKGGVKNEEIGLAVVFSKLAELVLADIRICKEMALAAFSLHPTKERFDKLEELAAVGQRTQGISTVRKEASGSAVFGEIKIKSPSKSTVSRDEENKSPFTDMAATTLGLSEVIIQELGVIVDGVRWGVLTWNIGWEQLEPLCRHYLDNQETMRSVTNELHYLNIDYSQFNHVPKPTRGVYWGIEKGYENYLEQTVEIPKIKVPSRKTNQRRSKSKKLSRSSKSPKVLKKKTWMKKTTNSLKTSSESDISIDLNKCRTSPEVSPVPDGVKRSVRIQANKRASAERPRNSDTLVKRLRKIRINFDKWRVISSKPSTIEQQHHQLAHCSSLSYRPAANHFAPMLSTINMQPRVVLIRITNNSTTHLIPEASVNCYPWLVKEKIKEEYTGIKNTSPNVTGFDQAQASPICGMQTKPSVLRNKRRNVKISCGNEKSNVSDEKPMLVEDNISPILSDLFTTDIGLPEELGTEIDHDDMVSSPLLSFYRDFHQLESDTSGAELIPDQAVAASSGSKRSNITESASSLDDLLSIIDPLLQSTPMKNESNIYEFDE